MTLFKNPEEEIELEELLRVFPSGRYQSWMIRLKEYCQFITRCYNDTKEENEILRTINAELTNTAAKEKERADKLQKEVLHREGMDDEEDPCQCHITYEDGCGTCTTIAHLRSLEVAAGITKNNSIIAEYLLDKYVK